MKRLVAVAVGGLLSISMAGAVEAAPAGAPEQQQGISNSKKAMQSKLERDRKMREVRKQAQLKRQQLERKGK